MATIEVNCTDPVVLANIDALAQRSEFGMRKYGEPINAAGDQATMLTHALEEALDLANYLQSSIFKLTGKYHTPALYKPRTDAPASDEPNPTTDLDFHALAMRTAAGPESWHPQGHDEAHFVGDLLNGIQVLRQLDRWKSLLIYGKPKNESKFDKLPTVLNASFAKFANLNPELTHAILGIATEGGELLEHLLWNLIDPMDDRSIGIQEETGDVDWFQELLAHATGVPVDTARAQVIRKLRVRYPDKYTQEHSQLRLDKTE